MNLPCPYCNKIIEGISKGSVYVQCPNMTMDGVCGEISQLIGLVLKRLEE